MMRKWLAFLFVALFMLGAVGMLGCEPVEEPPPEEMEEMEEL